MKITEIPTTIVFSFIGYENSLLNLDSIPSSPIQIKLQKSILRLPDIEVIAEPKVEKLSPPIFTIMDFIISRDKILLIKDGGITFGRYLELIDMEGNVLHSRKIKLKDKIQHIHKSCLGNIHLVGTYEVIEVDINSDQIALNAKYSVARFEKVLEPCVDASDDFLYMKSAYLRGQYLHYDFVSKAERTIHNKVIVSDTENIYRMAEEQVAFDFSESYYDISRSNVDVINNPPPHPIVYESWFDLFYDPLFSPLYNTGDEICLFDHTQGQLRFYSFSGKLNRQLPITYHREKKWNKEILRDKKNGRFYTVYSDKRGKKFYEINLLDGTVSPVFKIETDFIAKMEIYDGHLFYLESGITPRSVNKILKKVKF